LVVPLSRFVLLTQAGFSRRTQPLKRVFQQPVNAFST
jgi:hypothetical protein